MSAAQHTQGRLKAFNLYATPEIRDQDDGFVAHLKDDGPRSVANARRLVACWNACEGLSTETLEVAGGGKAPNLLEIFNEHGELHAQRDELLAALEAAEGSVGDLKTLEIVRAATAKVKGGAA